MKKQILLVYLFASVVVPVFSQWSTDTLAGDRLNFQAVPYHDKVYFIGGETSSLYETKEVSVYNCITSAWDPADSLSLARSHAACIAGDSGIYVVGGRQFDMDFSHGYVRHFNPTNRVDMFRNGVWTIDSIPDRVWGGQALHVGSKILFAGFADSISYMTSEVYASKKVYIYDESTGTWSVDSLSTARTEVAAATNGTLAIFAGGLNGLGVVSDVVDIYDAISGTWSTASLSSARAYAGGGYANGKFYFAGGVLGGIVNMTTDVIDVFDGTAWTIEHLSVPRAGVMVEPVNNYVYFMGGGQFDLSLLLLPNSGGVSLAVDILNITSGDWSRTDYFYNHLYGAHATWGNKIFVAGGGKKWWTQSNQLYVFTDLVEIRDVTLGLFELNSDLNFEIFPNPSTGPVTLLLPVDRAEVVVTDLLGKEVQKTRSTGREMQLHLNQGGVYFVRINSSRGSAVRKVVVSK